MRPLRFCMLTTFYPPYNFGGDGIGIQRLCRGLVRRGHHVTVVHDVDAWKLLSDGQEPEPVEEMEGLEVIGLRTSAPLLSELVTQQLGRPVFNGRRLRAILAEGRFDVINYHNISLVGGPGILAMGDAVKLYMAHEHWLVCPTHVLWRHMRERCTGRQCLRCQLHYRRPPQLWRFTGLLERRLEHVDLFIAMSEFSRAKHREFGFAPEMEVLPYFLPEIDEARASSEGSAPHDRPYFLFVGRLEKIKGLDDVIPLFARYPDADLLIAGEGAYGAELRAIGKDIPGVRFLGRVSSSEIRSLYAHALALIVPSVCFETFGIIVIEAFRQSLPVLVRRVGPLPELVEASGGGYSFDGGDELLAAMRKLQSDPEVRQGLADAGRSAFAERWTEEAVVPRYLQLVRQAAESKGATDVLQAMGD